MPVYTIQTPSGRKLKIEAPDEGTAMRGAQEWESSQGQQQQAEQPAAQAPPMAKAEASGFDVGQMVRNVPRSAVQFGLDMAQPFIHPKQTANNLLDVMGGAIQHGDRALGFSSGPPTPHMEKASAVGQFFKDRYGSLDATKRTLQDDPIGALGDASTVLTGGGTALARAPGLIGKAGRAAQTAGKAVDPLTPIMKTAGTVAKPLVGTLTGTGGDAIDIGIKAGRSDGPRATSFKEGMRGRIPEDMVWKEAKAALREMRDEKHTRYIQNIAASKANKKPINPTPISREWVKLKNEFTVQGAKGAYWTIDQKHVDLMDKIEKRVMEWQLDPGLHNVMGLDALKRQIEAYRPSMPDAIENRIVTTMNKSVKQLIEAKEPSYKAAMKDYESLSALESEIERTMSLGNNATGDTATRKLLSSLRNNVNTNFGRRKKLLDLLDEKRPGLKEAIAGQSMNSWAPRGLQQLLPPMILGGALLNPKLLAGLPLSSPRLMGEASLLAGRVGPHRGLLSSGLFQAGRADDRRNRGQY